MKHCTLTVAATVKLGHQLVWMIVNMHHHRLSVLGQH